MLLPRSTYRLQFRNGMDFAAARRLVPYLEKLGISHLYASPVMTAVNGSTHGYDVTNANRIDPSLGGLEGLRALSGDLQARGMGLILDIVPNHMAAHPENPWWRSVLLWGEESPYSHHFDIDWSQRLTLPFLGSDFAEELSNGAITLALDPRYGALALRYRDSFYPLHPGTYGLVIAGHDNVAKSPLDDPEGKQILSKFIAFAEAHEALERTLDSISKEPDRISAIHAAQPWQLADWRTASRHLSYRRFFEIAGLVGMRVENPDAFEESHRLVVELVRDGTVDGLRIDHVDGMADPAGYLERLRAAVGPDTYIVVEKILEKTEPFPSQWPVQGSTGYEFIAAMADALVDEREGNRLVQAFGLLKGENRQGSYDAERLAAKHQMLSENFEGEVHGLARLAKRIADATHADLSRASLAEAIRAVIAALPVYRTYATTSIGERDGQVLAIARLEALEGVRPDVREAIDFLWELLADDRVASVQPDCVAFRARFQQVSGPIMAKALEDTLFYRENAFIALNEVGGDPGRPTGGPDAFHAAMQARARTMPHGLSATSTHDTKRGEDGRARLYALSEAPDMWIAANRRWSGLNARFRRLHADRLVPEPDVEWSIYQSLAGAWPIDGRGQSLTTRMTRYVEKALREAKLGSNWTLPDIDYERMVMGFLEDVLENDAFLNDFAQTLSPFIAAGAMNSLTQALIKLTAPGIPDTYQGSERGDFSLVDPDNRAPLDGALRTVTEKPLPSRETFSAYKQWLVATVLAARNRQPDAFAGPYIPLLLANGARRAIAFLRGTPEAFAIVAVPRLTFARTAPEVLRLSDAEFRDSTIAIPESFNGRTVRSALGERTLTLGGTMALSAFFGTDPVALFLSA